MIPDLRLLVLSSLTFMTTTVASQSTGTLQISYSLTGSYAQSGITSSPASRWLFITNNTLVRHIEGSDPNHISDYATVVDTVNFTYGTPFTIQGGLEADAFTAGSQNASVSINLALRQTNLTVLSGGVPIDFNATSNTGSAAARNVSLGGSYAGFTLQNTSPYGHGSTVSILGGTASAAKTLNASFLGQVSGFTQGSDIVDVSGIAGDTFVLQLSYDPTLVTGLLGSEANAVLLWKDPSTGLFQNAVVGNSDGGAQSHAFTGAYNPGTEFALGNYGVDTVNHVVWAVVDHNSEFAVGQQVPEPGAWASLMSGIGMLTLWRRRRR